MKRLACSSPAGRGCSRSDSARSMPSAIASGARPDRRARPRRRRPRRATDGTRRRPGCRTPSPRRSGSRSPRRATDTRRRSRLGRAPGSCSSGTNPSAVTPSPASSCSAQWTGAPATTSSSSGRFARTSACAATSVDRFLRGSSVATARTYGSSRSALGPRACSARRRPGTRRRSARAESRASAPRRSAVNSEMATITSQVCAAFAVLRAVHAAGSAGAPTPDGAAERGRRRSSSAARRAARGYIQSEKWKTSSGPTSRSTFGEPSRLQAVRHRCATAAARPRSAVRPGGPSSASSMRARASAARPTREGDDLVLVPRPPRRARGAMPRR